MSKFVICLFRLVSHLPFWMFFILSDLEYLLAYHVLRYRRTIVRRNLTSSFPEKSLKEIVAIEKGFYHWFCDYFFETLKMLTMSQEEMLRHIEYHGVEAVEDCFDRGQDCAAILGHYGNWEYLSATPLALKRHPDAPVGLIYHPLYNKTFDQLFIDIRQSKKGVCIPKQQILRFLVTYRREKRNSLFGYIADQGPKWENIHLWLPFLGHETPVFTGTERIMRKMHNAVFYVDMERLARGRYRCTFKPISDDAANEEPFAITRRFFALLELSIRRDPQCYLWTHNRWKRTREEFERRFEIKDGKVVPRKTTTPA